jgi:hypothetical protein
MLSVPPCLCCHLLSHLLGVVVHVSSQHHHLPLQAVACRQGDSAVMWQQQQFLSGDMAMVAVPGCCCHQGTVPIATLQAEAHSSDIGQGGVVTHEVPGVKHCG